MSKRGKKTRRRRVLKVRRLKRKIRQQASKHAQDVERYQKEIQELKLPSFIVLSLDREVSV